MQKSVIYLVRHGAVDNPKGIFYGRLPRVRLSLNGIQEMEQVANYLKWRNIIQIFSSPLLRARQSAKILQQATAGSTISISKRLIEIDSFMEGKPFSFGKPIRFDHYFSPYRKPGNETMEAVFIRMMGFVLDVIKKYPGKNVAAVSHGDPIMILKVGILGMPLELDSIRPGKESYITYGEVLEVVSSGDRTLSIESVFNPT